MRHYVFDGAAEGPQAERLADDERMQCGAEHQRVFPRLIEHLVELVDHHFGELPAGVAAVDGTSGSFEAEFGLTGTKIVNLFLGDEANAGWDVRADSLGSNPIDDFEGALAAEGVDTTGWELSPETVTAAEAQQKRNESEL